MGILKIKMLFKKGICVLQWFRTHNQLIIACVSLIISVFFGIRTEIISGIWAQPTCKGSDYCTTNFIEDYLPQHVDSLRNWKGIENFDVEPGLKGLVLSPHITDTWSERSLCRNEKISNNYRAKIVIKPTAREALNFALINDGFHRTIFGDGDNESISEQVNMLDLIPPQKAKPEKWKNIAPITSGRVSDISKKFFLPQGTAIKPGSNITIEQTSLPILGSKLMIISNLIRYTDINGRNESQVIDFEISSPFNEKEKVSNFCLSMLGKGSTELIDFELTDFNK